MQPELKLKVVTTIEDQVLDGLDNCITTMGTCCRKNGYYGRQACNRVIRKTSPPQRHHMYSEQVDLGYDIALINGGRSIEDTKYNMNADITRTSTLVYQRNLCYDWIIFPQKYIEQISTRTGISTSGYCGQQ